MKILGAVVVAVFAATQAPVVLSPALPPPPAATPQLLQTYKPVTTDRLRNPDAGDWLMVRRTYDGWGYSPLEQISRANVDRLRPVWTFATGVTNGHEAPPIVNNGVMFVATPGNQVIAIDARTGGVLWRYRRPLPDEVILLHGTSRGVALYRDKVFFAAGEAVLVALDAATGKEAWTAEVADNSGGYYLSMAPLVADGKVMVGASGGEFGVRGFVAAFDADSGKPLWKTYTVPAPGELGSETWPSGDHWKTGGAPVWVTANYDPSTNLTFWGTGNGGPWVGDQRPGDNLYTSSTVAIDAATGRIKGHFQYHPNDSWDWDEVSPPILVDYQRGGRTIKGLVDVARDGYLWFLERTDGRINFVDGRPYVTQNVFRGLDPKSGRPDVDPARRPGTGQSADFCPSHWGGKNWPPIAYSPKTRMIYIPANENLCGRIVGRPVTYAAGRGFTGATSVTYNGTSASYSVTSDTYISATVPSGAGTGFVNVVTPGGTLTSNLEFRVTPTVASFSPASGPVGTQVTITGNSLTQASKVTFGGVKAVVFSVNSDTKITATVPAGAVTGKIQVTTPGGTATSLTAFTVN
jgi:alcohol dehydrogenase (cytochrome c)